MTHEHRPSGMAARMSDKSTPLTCVRKWSAYRRRGNALARAIGPHEIRRFLVPRPPQSLSIQRVAASIDHLHRTPDMSIHHFTDTCAALQQGRGRIVSEIVQPHRRCSDLLACFSEGPFDRVRVVVPLCRQVRREDMAGGFDCRSAFSLPLHRLASSAP